MVILKKTEAMDSPAASSDSYVIIKNDYDSNSAYVLKDPLDMGEQLNYLLLDIVPPGLRISLC